MEYNYSVADMEPEQDSQQPEQDSQQPEQDSQQPEQTQQSNHPNHLTSLHIEEIKKQSHITDFFEKLRRTNEANIVRQSRVEPLEQTDKKCAWCGQYLVYGPFDDYNGSDPLYKGWICHRSCNITNGNDDTFVDLEAQQTTPISQPVQKSIIGYLVDAMTYTDE